ncbi:MAG: (2Fe-2S) ferredoxin domain-containing protein [Myxococcales bacterium]|nr:(2Fe-2S) ferredoxin domain-containing protein [Myxococcales bacterium]
MALSNARESRYAPLVPEFQILVCVNEREGGQSCCGAQGGKEIREALKEAVGKLKLKPRLRVSQTGCLGVCPRSGVTIAVYPENLVYTEVEVADVPALIERHLAPRVDSGKVGR